MVCQSGTRGRQACEKLLAAGLSNVWNVAGGTIACQQAGLPVVCGRKAISLERQVRIAAGSLVLLGVVLSFQAFGVSVGFRAFVCAGLVFAGITYTCGWGCGRANALEPLPGIARPAAAKFRLPQIVESGEWRVKRPADDLLLTTLPSPLAYPPAFLNSAR